MKTSRFANSRHIKVPLSISQGPPKWYTGPQLKLLAPPWELVNKAARYTKEQYTAEFHRLVLDQLDPIEVYQAIIAEYTDDVVLLCFEEIENPGDFCHRRMVAEWLEKANGVEIPEWQKPEPKFFKTLKF